MYKNLKLDLNFGMKRLFLILKEIVYEPSNFLIEKFTTVYLKFCENGDEFELGESLLKRDMLIMRQQLLLLTDRAALDQMEDPRKNLEEFCATILLYQVSSTYLFPYFIGYLKAILTNIYNRNFE